MIVAVSFSSLRDSHWYEYIVRFLLGGTATVTTGLISSQLRTWRRRPFPRPTGDLLRQRDLD
jgi:hypothetical protein